ncbi:response regulator [Okeania sp. SIO2B9]|uniref:response regulator n=1 Tax=Okeania sp. SIO2B9 TaxID=2607782 RepID=UPI00257F4E17|nr:response regulator [Okeania sp. SIO2B9]
MSNFEELLALAEELTQEKMGNSFSDLQRTVLLTTLQGNRMTYDQIAEECGYSPKYLKQDIAPKLWQLLSEVLGKKITKSNIKAILEKKLETKIPDQPQVPESSLSMSFSPVSLSPVPSSPVDLSPVLSVSEKGNILLVDDQPENLKLLSDLLEEQGYEVQQAINGVIALQAITVGCPDVVLLDIHMPQLDGYIVCQKLKENPKTKDIPVIFVSALDEAWDKVKAFSVGGSDYITKPFKTVEVLARVENQLKVRHLQLQVKCLQEELEKKNYQLQQALQKLQSTDYQGFSPPLNSLLNNA